MASSGPNLGLIVEETQGVNWYDEARRLLRGLDGLVQPSVKDKDLTAPPGSPSDGDCYIVGASATGDWATHDDDVARYSSVETAWEFFTPKEGWHVYVQDENLRYLYNGSAWASVPEVSNAIKDVAVPFIIDGGGSAITTGVKGFIEIPYAGTIQSVRLLADQSGSIVIDLWKDTYANYPPTVADTITASAKPTLSSATKAEDTTLTGWTTSVSAGDILGVNVDSAATVTRVTLSLVIRRS